MFSSRAEYRLSLRQDNADRRLVRRAAAVGLVGREAVERLDAREARIAGARDLLRRLRSAEHGGRSLEELLKRPDETLSTLARRAPELAPVAADPDLAAAVEADVKYAGYVEREKRDVERLRRQETLEIPPELDVASLAGLGVEAREQLRKLRPRTLGQAGRIPGIRPPDVALLAVHVERHRRAQAR